MKRSLVSCGLLISLVLLPGCSVLRQVNHAFQIKPKRHSVIRDAQAADKLRENAVAVKLGPKIAKPAIYTEIARDQLDAGNFGLAIETFGLAREAGEPEAPIFNGLGVAYANLGRADVAAHNFRLAIAADQNEERYRWNLAKLLASTEMALTRDRRVQTAQVEPGSDVVLPQTRGALVEIAPRQFMIRTIPISGPALRAAEAHSGKKVVENARSDRIAMGTAK